MPEGNTAKSNKSYSNTHKTQKNTQKNRQEYSEYTKKSTLYDPCTDNKISSSFVGN